MTSTNPNPTLDYLQQLQVLSSINTVDRDLWKSQTNQSNDLLNHAERMNFQNEYRGNRSFDGLNNRVIQVGAENLAATKDNGAVLNAQAERIAGANSSQNERIAALLSQQNERIGAAGISTTEAVGSRLTTQAERIHNDIVQQNERIGAATFTQNERIGAALGNQGERIANQIGFQNERIATQTGVQAERINNDIKGLLNQNFTQTLDGLHDVRARNTDNFAKTWVAQAEANSLAYRNTADLAKLSLEHAGKNSLEIHQLEMGLGKLVNDSTNQLMRMNMEQFAKMQIDAAKTEAALSKQGTEQTYTLSKQLSAAEDKIVDKVTSIENQRLRDKAYLGAARGLVLDEYHHRNFHAGQDPYWHHHHRRRSHSHSRSPSPRRRHRRHDDDDTRINVVTNIRDNNELDSRIRNGAGAAAII